MWRMLGLMMFVVFFFLFVLFFWPHESLLNWLMTPVLLYRGVSLFFILTSDGYFVNI